MIGKKVWTVGYYGGPGFCDDEAAILVDNFNYLRVTEELPHHSFARLDGDLPKADLDGAEIMFYGEVNSFALTYDVPANLPTPLITVEKYEIVYDGSPPAGWENQYVLELASLAEEPLVFSPQGETSATQASDCDRALVISGGVDSSNNHRRYGYDVEEKYKALKRIGFSDEHIDVIYYSGTKSSISVDGKEIVDAKATVANIQATIDKYRKEMNPSCTLIVMVTDHGTGFNKDQGYSGARPAFDCPVESGSASKTYAESSFKFDARKKVVDSTNDFNYRGELWKYYKDETGKAWISKKIDGKWIKQGSDSDGDGFMEEHELGHDLNGDGDSTDNYGLRVSWMDARIEWVTRYDNKWDTDRDGTDDVWLHWDGTKYVVKRYKDRGWKTMGEDKPDATTGQRDYIIDNSDGGIDWNLDGDTDGDSIGFHEGINLFEKEVLWDDQMAEMLRPLTENGVHIRVEMMSCFSGGFVNNLESICVESIVAACEEDKKSWSRNKDAGARPDAKWDDTFELEFAKNLAGLDAASWGQAYQKASAADNTKWEADTASMSAAAKAEQENKHQVGGKKYIPGTWACYTRHEDGTYVFSLEIPKELEGKVYDFEIILGLQDERWSLSLGEGIGYPYGLPPGMDSEIIPGGIRVFSDNVIAGGIFNLRAPDGAALTRIDLTGVNHECIGYISVSECDTPLSTSLPPVEDEITSNISGQCRIKDSVDGCTATLIADVNYINFNHAEAPVVEAWVTIDGHRSFTQRFSTGDEPDESPAPAIQGTDPDPIPSKVSWKTNLQSKGLVCGHTYTIGFHVRNSMGQVISTYKTVVCPAQNAQVGSGGAVGGGGVMPCFAPDTLVAMANQSTKRIADVQTGDVVLAFDAITGTIVTHEVIATNCGEADHYYLINGSLKVTPPHPFHTTDERWIATEDLVIGDEITGLGTSTVIESIERIDEPQPICNIIVEELSNFFVSADGQDFYLVDQGN